VEKSSKLLFDEEPIAISRALSRILGPSKAIALQQIHYWCEKSKGFVNPSEHFINGRWWVYNTYEEWTRQFCIGSERTVRRILKELESKELLLVANHNKDKNNRTNWYAINHEKLDELREKSMCPDPSGQPVKTNDVPCGQTDKASGQSVKSIDKMSTCIKNTENTQRIPENINNINIFKEYTTNPKLLTALERFTEMRMEIGKKLTLAATKMLLDDLDDFANSDDEKILILKKSIINNWKEIFALPKSKTQTQDDIDIRIKNEMKHRGETPLEPVNPDDYYDWIGEIKRKD